jgi:hypothetical protein
MFHVKQLISWTFPYTLAKQTQPASNVSLGWVFSDSQIQGSLQTSRED